MGWTKRDYITTALEEIGIGTQFDVQPDQLTAAVRRLDAMLAEWNSNGVRIAWPMPSSPSTSDLNTDTGTPDAANSAIYLNLAVRLCPQYGKEAPPSLKGAAAVAFMGLQSWLCDPVPERQFPQTMPRGAGNKPLDMLGSGQFYPTPSEGIDAGPDAELEFT